MDHSFVIVVAGLLAGGVLAQWLGWRLQVPSIVFLLAGGIVAGPATGVLDPDAVFGDLLLPSVSLAVAVILFEGALGLRWSRLTHAGRTVTLLLTVGATITLAGTTLAAHYVLDTPWNLSALLAATLVVTGPTVVGPIVRAIGLRGKVGSILESEGTLIDSLGAILALLVFQAGFQSNDGASAIVRELATTLGVGIGFGLAGAAVLVIAFGWYLVPDDLDNVMTLATVLGVFAAADAIRMESGLVAVTVMGIALASQKRVEVHHVLRFNETLRIVFISVLFVVLAARIEPETLRQLEWRNLAFLAILVVAIRPIAVAVCTVGSSLTRGERTFLAATAPRGIVAAAVASIFSLQLSEIGVANSQILVSATFTVIVGTVLMAGLTSKPLAQRLGLLDVERKRVIVMGANPVARMFASALESNGVEGHLIDGDRSALAAARMSGLSAADGARGGVAQWSAEAFEGAVAFVAMTDNPELNALSCRQAAAFIGRRNVYQLVAPGARRDTWWRRSIGTFGRPLFDEAVTYRSLAAMIDDGARVASTRITEKFRPSDYLAVNPASVVLFEVDEDGTVNMVATDIRRKPKVGDVFVALSPVPASNRSLVEAQRRAAVQDVADAGN